jgi:HD superfamily phosphodiesterase
VTESGDEEKRQREMFSRGELKAVGRKGPSAISHFYDKLVFLKDMLKTQAGRALGEKRHKFILTFLDEFFDELSY